MSNRRRALASAAALAGVLVIGAGGSAAAETLYDAVQLAYDTNPTLQAQRASQRALDETVVQAKSAFGPTITALSTTTYTDPRTTSQWNNTVGFTASQLIYSGGRAITATNAAQADVLQGRENLRTVEAQVMLNTVQAYVDIRRDIASVEINQKNLQVLQRQLQETSARFDVGEVTRTDVAQAEARLALAQSSLSAAQGQLSISRANYASVVGQAAGELAAEPVLPGLPDTFDDAIRISEQDNAALRASQFAQQATKFRVAEARSDYMPNVSLRANYNLQTNPSFGLSLGDRDEFTATANVTVPIFTSGLTGSRVRQSIERDNTARLQVDASRRTVLDNTSSAWAQLISARANVTSNEEQVRANTVAAEGVRQEAQVGLRTTLDVLNAEQELANSALALVRAQHDAYVAAALVLQSMGRLEAKNLVQQVKVEDPKAYYDRVEGKAGLPVLSQAIATLDRLAAPSGDHKYKDKPAPVDKQLRQGGTNKPKPRKP